MPQGTVEWIYDAKGFDFHHPRRQNRYFVNYNAIQQEGFKSLKEGNAVEFEISQGEKGL